MGRRGGARITLNNVRHAFEQPDSTVEVLRDISFSINRGQILAIVGPSGSGKSTILNLIALGLRPSGGQVEVATEDGASMKLAVAFQDPTLLPWLSAAENIRLPLELGGEKSDIDRRVADALVRMKLTEFAGFRPRQLSGGMQSRIALARAIVSAPDLLILDEPFGSLDEATAELIMIDLVRELEELGATSVLVTHSLAQAVYMADQVLVLSARPARVAATLEVSGPRPRSRAFLEEPVFLDSLKFLRRALREAVVAPAA